MSDSTRLQFVSARHGVGAAVGALVVVPMLSPSLAFGLGAFRPESDYRYARSIATTLVLFGFSYLQASQLVPSGSKPI